MKKEELKSDLIVFKKLEDDIFNKYITKAYNIYNDLNISNVGEFYTYQLYIDDLKKVTYEEIISYKRLLNVEYFDSIKLLHKQITNNSKVISFPKIIN